MLIAWKRSGRAQGVRRMAMMELCIIALGMHAAFAQNLWDLFSTAYTTNVLAWTRHNENPVIGASGSTWKTRWTGRPELIGFHDRTLLFYQGNGILPGKGKGYYDRIGVAEVVDIGSMKITYRDLNSGLPVLDVGKAGEFDGAGVLDPAAVLFKGNLYLAYSAVGRGPNSIGLAVSVNGEQFSKLGKVLEGQTPDLLVVGDTLFMVYQKQDSVGRKVYLAFSTDGKKFFPASTHPVFAGKAGRWDAKSINTPRVWEYEGVYYMLYGGSPDFVDAPEFFGLARSNDLRQWETHPGNPVFGAGIHGTADGGAIWYPAVQESGSWIVMLYEGSRGKRTWDPLSSICMAWIAKR
jgi:predicted GH43/DUF377 family glycosyl hydrolase